MTMRELLGPFMIHLPFFIRKYQKNIGIPVTGELDTRTIRSLFSENRMALKVKPIVSEAKIDPNEDFSDPEEFFEVQEIPCVLPTCDNELELIQLISEWTRVRNIVEIIHHCTATLPTASVDSIMNYWRNVLGWKNPGYHIIVAIDGSWTLLADFNSIVNGVRGRNSGAIHISYIGGIGEDGKPLDTRTPGQKRIMDLATTLLVNKIPGIPVKGHNEYSNKACPSYRVNGSHWVSVN
jgi:N-acetylmuramoyl-L-alanine amidase